MRQKHIPRVAQKLPPYQEYQMLPWATLFGRRIPFCMRARAFWPGDEGCAMS